MAIHLEQHWIQRARVLTQALIISGTLNIGLLSTFIYVILKERQEVVSLEMQSSLAVRQSFTNDQILKSYSKCSFQDLLIRLENKEFLEDGYAKRDLALSCLTAFHYFPLSKVLGGAGLQKRGIIFQGVAPDEKLEITAFSGLKDEHFEAILQFARTEKWPLTAQGIFLLLQRSTPPYDASLLESFYVTPEFHHIQALLQKSVPSIEKAVLVDLLKSGTWERLKKSLDSLRLLQNYDEESSRNFLMVYAFGFGSKVAASALLQHQAEYVLKRLKDEQLLSFFDLDLDQKEVLESMAKDILLSPRSDVLRQKAAEYLYSAAQELMPQPYNYQAALNRFFPEKVQQSLIIQPILKVEPAQPIQILKVCRIHTIQEGDSLWKIARKYGTTVDAISKLNSLESERLKLGKKLQIPEKAP